MRIVIQRVSNGSVAVDGKVIGTIQKGLLVFVGIEDADTAEDVIWLSNKMVKF